MSTPNDHPLSLAVLRERYGERHRWWVLVTVMIGNMAANMATTTINVAVPAISDVFSLGQQQAQWLATAFMGPMTLAMLTTPWLLQRFGYRRTTLAVLMLLGAGGLAGGVAGLLEPGGDAHGAGRAHPRARTDARPAARGHGAASPIDADPTIGARQPASHPGTPAVSPSGEGRSMKIEVSGIVERPPEATFYVFGSARDLPEPVSTGMKLFRAALEAHNAKKEIGR